LKALNSNSLRNLRLNLEVFPFYYRPTRLNNIPLPEAYSKKLGKKPLVNNYYIARQFREEQTPDTCPPNITRLKTIFDQLPSTIRQSDAGKAFNQKLDDISKKPGT
jgi:hypothetical protein